MSKLYYSVLVAVFLYSCSFSKSNSSKDSELSTLVRTDRSFTPIYEVKGKYIYRLYCTPVEKKPFCEKWEVMSLGDFLDQTLTPEKVERFWRSWDEDRNQIRKKKELENLVKSYEEKTKDGTKISSRLQREYDQTTKRLQNEINDFQDDDYWKEYLSIKANLKEQKYLEKNFKSQFGKLLLTYDNTTLLRLDGKFFDWGRHELFVDSIPKSLLAKLKNISTLKEPIKDIATNSSQICVIDAVDLLSCFSEGDEWARFKNSSGVDLNRTKYKRLFAGIVDLCMQRTDGKLDCISSSGSKAKEFIKQLQSDPTYTSSIDLFSMHYWDLCAQTKTGEFKCYGENFNKKNIEKFVQDNPGKLPFRNIKLQYHSLCVIDKQGEVFCFGNMQWYNTYFQLTLKDQKIKTPIKFLSLNQDEDSICIVDDEDKIDCRSNIEKMVVGNREGSKRLEYPKPILGIEVGTSYACAVNGKREVFCWGENNKGGVTGRDQNGYKIGEYVPEDTKPELADFGYFHE